MPAARRGPAIILALEYGCPIDGIELRTAFAEAAQRRIVEAELDDLISITVADATEVSFERGKYDAALCLGAAFVWGHIGDAATALASVVGGGRAIAVVADLTDAALQFAKSLLGQVRPASDEFPLAMYLDSSLGIVLIAGVIGAAPVIP